MIKRKSGFTLMEIMVVIIVIAVLASVAGPMIGSITDQGRASATKSKLSSLKSALLAYQSDLGRLPNNGSLTVAADYNGETLLSPNEEDKNVLYSNEIELNSVKNYQRKWKGPYMDSDPTDFMYDSWGNQIQYVAFNKNIYLWSYGADQEPYNTATGEKYNLDIIYKLQTNPNSEAECDDILVSVHRSRKPMGVPSWTGLSGGGSGSGSGSGSGG